VIATAEVAVAGQRFTNPEVLIGDHSSAITVGTPPLTGWGGSGLGGRFGWWGIKTGVAKFGQVTATVQELTILGGLRPPNLSLSVAGRGRPVRRRPRRWARPAE
jgi:hypothetical protein